MLLLLPTTTVATSSASKSDESRMHALRSVTGYTLAMIKTWRHKGVAEFFTTGKKGGIQPHQAAKLQRLLAVLNAASSAEAMNLPGFGWHPLSGDLVGHWAVSVNGNWRLTYSFEGTDAVLGNYQDYH